MIHYDDDLTPPKNIFHIFIGDEEWKNYSYENKIRLLYRLRQSESFLAKELCKPISLLVEEEQLNREIDFEATLKKIEETGD